MAQGTHSHLNGKTRNTRSNQTKARLKLTKADIKYLCSVFAIHDTVALYEPQRAWQDGLCSLSKVSLGRLHTADISKLESFDYIFTALGITVICQLYMPALPGFCFPPWVPPMSPQLCILLDYLQTRSIWRMPKSTANSNHEAEHQNISVAKSRTQLGAQYSPIVF